jgi:hypothetical protein
VQEYVLKKYGPKQNTIRRHICDGHQGHLNKEETNDIKYKNEKEKSKKESLRGLILVLGAELGAKKKFIQLDHWQYQYLDTVLELLTGAKKNFKNWTGKRRNC